MNFEAAGASSFPLWRATNGTSQTNARILVQNVGGTFELLGSPGGGGTSTGWLDTGFGIGDSWHLQVRYEPEDDILMLWWGVDATAFGGAAMATVDGASGVVVDGNYINVVDGWTLVMDHWACDGSND